MTQQIAVLKPTHGNAMQMNHDGCSEILHSILQIRSHSTNFMRCRAKYFEIPAKDQKWRHFLNSEVNNYWPISRHNSPKSKSVSQYSLACLFFLKNPAPQNALNSVARCWCVFIICCLLPHFRLAAENQLRLC